MRILLIRHGQSAGNEGKFTQGQSNQPLTEFGKDQIKKVAKRLSNERIDFIYSSDLDRARQTAEGINKFHNLPIVLDKRLREQSKGKFEGRPREETNLEMKRQNISFHEFKFSDGESYSEVQKRMIEVLEEILKKHKEGTIAVITHGGPIRSFMCYLNNESLECGKNYGHENTGVTLLGVNNGEMNILKINDFEHLK